MQKSGLAKALRNEDIHLVPTTLDTFHTIMTDIANSTLFCMRSFSRLIAALATGEQEHRESMPPKKIEIEHGRFKIWSGNLGALRSDRSSLDFRLRESFVMQSNVMKLLMKLDQILQRSKWIPDYKCVLYTF